MSDSIATLIAKEVIALMKAEGLLVKGSAAGGPPKETIPADTDDEPTGTAPKSKRASKAKPAPEPEPEPPEDDDADEDEDEDTDDLVTASALEFVSDTADEANEPDMRSELLDFYVAQGHDKDEISGTLADMDEDDLREAYKDYLARLLKVDAIDGEPDFIEDFEEAYKSVRTFEGEEKLVWAKGGITLSDEEAEELGLGDPAAPAKKKGPVKRTKKPGKK